LSETSGGSDVPSTAHIQGHPTPDSCENSLCSSHVGFGPLKPTGKTISRNLTVSNQLHDAQL
jgi:hypothetical protein